MKPLDLYRPHRDTRQDLADSIECQVEYSHGVDTERRLFDPLCAQIRQIDRHGKFALSGHGWEYAFERDEEEE